MRNLPHLHHHQRPSSFVADCYAPAPRIVCSRCCSSSTVLLRTSRSRNALRGTGKHQVSSIAISLSLTLLGLPKALTSRLLHRCSLPELTDLGCRRRRRYIRLILRLLIWANDDTQQWLRLPPSQPGLLLDSTSGPAVRRLFRHPAPAPFHLSFAVRWLVLQAS